MQIFNPELEMNNRPLLSLIIPVYKVEKYISSTLESLLLGANFPEVEVVFINDLTPDKSFVLIENFIKENSSVINFKYQLLNDGTKLGVAGARNQGLKKSRGRYIGFLDSDDQISEKYFPTLRNIISSNLDIIEFGYREFSGTLDQPLRSTSSRELGDKDSPFNRGFFLWSRIYSNEILQGLEFPEGKIYEDVYFTVKVFSRASRIYVIGDELVAYRKHSGSITAKRDADYAMFVENLVLAYKESINNYSDKEKAAKALLKKTAIILMKGMRIKSVSERKLFVKRAIISIDEMRRLKINHKLAFKQWFFLNTVLFLCRLRCNIR